MIYIYMYSHAVYSCCRWWPYVLALVLIKFDKKKNKNEYIFFVRSIVQFSMRVTKSYIIYNRDIKRNFIIASKTIYCWHHIITAREQLIRARYNSCAVVRLIYYTRIVTYGYKYIIETKYYR